MAEIEVVLHDFSKDKALGSNDWPVEFYFGVSDLVGNEILSAVEYNRVRGCIPSVLNATYIALIPKCGMRWHFVDFWPISLCNLIYKVITKILADCMKPYLAEVLSKE